MSAIADRLDAMNRARTWCRLATIGVEVPVPVGVDVPLSAGVVVAGVGLSVRIISLDDFDFFSFFSLFLLFLSSFSLLATSSEVLGACCSGSSSDTELGLSLDLFVFFSFFAFFSLGSLSLSSFSFDLLDFFRFLDESWDSEFSVDSCSTVSFDRFFRFFSLMMSETSADSASSAFRFLDFFSFFAFFDCFSSASTDSAVDCSALSALHVAGSVLTSSCIWSPTNNPPLTNLMVPNLLSTYTLVLMSERSFLSVSIMSSDFPFSRPRRSLKPSRPVHSVLCFWRCFAPNPMVSSFKTTFMGAELAALWRLACAEFWAPRNFPGVHP